MSPKLDKRDLDILAALVSLGQNWHSRSAIAERLGRVPLQAEDLISLDYLVGQGLVEKGTNNYARGKSRIAYRVTQNGGQQ